MRGEKATPHKAEWQVIRIIPACAGKSSLYFCNSSFSWDHPRMRGEKWNMTKVQDTLTGSSPHARGKALHRMGEASYHRIIPACAGKSSPVHLGDEYP